MVRDTRMDKNSLSVSVESIMILLLSWSIPVLLLAAHFKAGADIAVIAAIFVAIFCGLFILASLVLGFENIRLGIAIIAGLFLTWLGLGLFGNWHQAQHEILCLIGAGGVTALGYTIGRTPGGLKQAWSALIWTLLAFAVVAAILFSLQFSDARSLSARLSGAFESPNTAATLLGIAMLVGASKLLVRFQDARFIARQRGDRIAQLAQKEFASIVLLVVAAGCLLFTISRAGIVFSLLAVFALIGFELARISRRGQASILKRKRVAIGFVLLALIVLALAVSGEINPNVEEALLENASGRIEANEIYWGVFAEKPWFGHGLGSFNAVNDEATTLDNAATLMPLGAAHNVLMQWLLQQGVIGISAMLFVFGMIFYPIVSALSSPSKKPRNFLRLVIAATFLVFAHGMVDYALEIPSVMWTYAYLLGLAAGYASSIRVTHSKPAD